MFVKLHYNEVEALIKMIEDDFDLTELTESERKAYDKLKLMASAMTIHRVGARAKESTNA